MSNGTVVSAGTGQISITANGDIALTGLFTDNASANAVIVTSANGAITDAGSANTDIDANAVGSKVTLTAKSGIGSANAIELDVATLSFVNSSSGNVSVSQNATAGNITVSGDNQAANGTVSIEVSGDNKVLTVGVGNVTTVNGTVTLTADDMDIQGNIAAGTGNIVLTPANTTQLINLGSNNADGSNLSLNAAELNRLSTSGFVRVGKSDSGNVEISNSIVITSFDNLAISTAGTITDSNATGADLNVANLALHTGNGTVGNLEVTANTVAAEVSGDGNLALVGLGNLNIASVDGLSNGLYIAGQGDITLEGNADINIDANVVAANGHVSMTANNSIAIPATVSAVNHRVLLTSVDDVDGAGITVVGAVSAHELGIDSARVVTANGNVSFFAASVSNGSLTYTNRNDLIITTVGTITGIDVPEEFVGIATVTSTEGNLTVLDQAFANVNAYTLELSSNGTITFAANSNVDVEATTTLKANDLSIANSANITANQAISIQAYTDGKNVNLGLVGSGAGNIAISNEEIGRLRTRYSILAAESEM